MTTNTPSHAKYSMKKIFLYIFLATLFITSALNKDQSPKVSKSSQIVLDDSSLKLETEAILNPVFNGYRVLMVTFHGINPKTVDKVQAEKIVRLYLDKAIKDYPDENIQVFAYIRKNKSDDKFDDLNFYYLPDESCLIYEKKEGKIRIEIPPWIREKKAFDALPKEEQLAILKQKAEQKTLKDKKDREDKIKEAAIKLEKLKADSESRRLHQDLLRQKFLDKGLNIKVKVSGKYNENITLSYVLFDEVWFHKFNKEYLFDDLNKNWGYKKVTLSDGGYNYQQTMSYKD